MAIGASISKVSLNIADIDRQHYAQHELTLAVHPSENDFRFIVRVIAFALNAHERLAFTRGLGADDEPELWLKSLTGEVELWIDFGQVDEKRIRKACGRARRVVVYTYQARKSQVWWQQARAALARHANLAVYHVQAEGADALVARNMDLQCLMDDGSISVSDESRSIDVSVTRLQ